MVCIPHRVRGCPYCQGKTSLEPARYGHVEGDARALRKMVADCEPYLKDGETPAQRIERERRDTEAVLTLLVREKQKTERLAAALNLIAERTGSEDPCRALVQIARDALSP